MRNGKVCRWWCLNLTGQLAPFQNLRLDFMISSSMTCLTLGQVSTSTLDKYCIDGFHVKALLCVPSFSTTSVTITSIGRQSWRRRRRPVSPTYRRIWLRTNHRALANSLRHSRFRPHQQQAGSEMYVPKRYILQKLFFLPSFLYVAKFSLFEKRLRNLQALLNQWGSD